MNSHSLWSRFVRSALISCTALGLSLWSSGSPSQAAPSHSASPSAAASWPRLADEFPKGAGSAAGAKDAALVVGIEDYAFVGDIRGARQNAEDWWSYFRKSRGIPRDGARILRDQEGTREKILREAKEVASKIKDGGTLWFIFIGHGVASGDGEEGMLVGADAQGEADSLDARSIRQSELEGIFRHSKASKVMMVIDSCFSGRTPDGKSLAPGLQALVRRSQTQVDQRIVRMSAGKSDQFAGPLPGGDRPAFSYLMLGAMLGWGDADHNGVVTAREAVDYTADVLDSLERTRRQTPELIAADLDLALPLSSGAKATGPDIDRMVLTMFNNNVPDNTLPAQTDLPPAPPEDPAPAPQDNVQSWTIDSIIARPSDPPSAGSNEGPRAPIPAIYIPDGRYTPAKNIVRHEYRTEQMKGFYLGKTPVTVGQYGECVQAGICQAPAYYDKCSYFRADPKKLPMDCLKYADAETFCRWAGGRLPSEAEWEYAATHNGKKQRRTTFPWGDKRPYTVTRHEVVRAKVQYANFSLYGDESSGTTPVGSYPKGNSPLGLTDLSGNVNELASPALTGEKYVLKGGGYLGANRLEALEVGEFSAVGTSTGGGLTYGVRCAWDSQPRAANAHGQHGSNAPAPAPAPQLSGTHAARSGHAVPLEFVHIPGGPLISATGVGRPASRLNSFGIAKHPVTVEEFTQCILARACSADHFYKYDSSDGKTAFCNLERGGAWERHPMNCVDQKGAQEFCRWAGGRLPTEAEWRFAAGHNGKTFVSQDYPWGRDKKPHPCQKANFAAGAHNKLKFCFGTRLLSGVRTSRRGPLQPPPNAGTSTVGLFSPAGDTPLGLSDMTGNVDEWTDSPGLRHLCGQGDVPCFPVKGGAWNSEVTTLDDKIRGGSRLNLLPMDHKGPDVGFRCVRNE